MTRLYVRVAARGNASFLAWRGARRRAVAFGAMTAGARTPEELDDAARGRVRAARRAALEALFDAGAVLVAGGGLEARGRAAIGRALAALWAHDRTYVAAPRHVLQARDTALIVAESGIHVLQRDRDGTWRVRDLAAGTRHTDQNGARHDAGHAAPRAHGDARKTRARRAGGSTAWPRSRRRAEQTGGLLSIIEITEPPGRGRAAARAPPRRRGLLDPRGRRHVRGRRHDDRGAAPATSSSARAASRTATPSARTAAGCCSS